MHQYWTYILTNPARNVMYVGVTNNLENRVAEHRAGTGSVFTRRYNVSTLVYAEDYQYIEDAIAREKEIKAWRRSKKNALAETVNPTWADLFDPGDAFKDPSL
ncbi:MAG TPA: GIY-YIG nuclease family protein [Reyranella sp.]|nr:GIY-YIG nuclease family protein [Reyranella sp.]